MDWFKGLIERVRSGEKSESSVAIERAVTSVEPLLKQSAGYPKRYRKAVETAVSYSRMLALKIPGPVKISTESYAMDAYVHAIFPSIDSISDALCGSRAIQEYHQTNPDCHEVYALMGMRRKKKVMHGIQLTGQLIHQDVTQKMVYFTSHTLDSPAPTELQARELLAWSFFDKLVNVVAKRIDALKNEKQALLMEIDLQKARLHSARTVERSKYLKDLNELIRKVQNISKALDLSKYHKLFNDVLLSPEQYLYCNKTEMLLDSMGVIDNHQDFAMSKSLVFSDLIGFDQRAWTVTMVYCHGLEGKNFATRLDEAYRNLSI